MKNAMCRRNSWLPTNGRFPTVFDEFLNNDMLNTASNVAPSVNVMFVHRALALMGRA